MQAAGPCATLCKPGTGGEAGPYQRHKFCRNDAVNGTIKLCFDVHCSGEGRGGS